MKKYYHFDIEYTDNRGYHRDTSVIAEDELGASRIAEEDYHYVGYTTIEECGEATEEEYDNQ